MRKLSIRKIAKTMLFAAIFIMVGVQYCAALGKTESQYVPYSTYSYDYRGNPVITPHAYIPHNILSGADTEAGEFSFPSDIERDSGGNIYISDTGNNRIIKMDSNYKATLIIEGFKSERGEDGFDAQQGLFIRDDELYVADTGNARILKFKTDGSFIRSYNAPSDALFGESFRYEPKALVADELGNIFVVSQGVNMGIIRFNASGEFVSFYGSQEASYSALDLFWKRFMTEEQLKRMQDFIPMEYNNISIDSDGFIFATTSDLDVDVLVSAISTRSSASRAAPVRRLNPAGKDILARSGYFPPVGDVSFGLDDSGKLAVSVIVDVAVGENGVYSLLDSRQNRIFTYSSSGDLLYAFSTQGEQIGNTVSPSALMYNGKDLLLLDKGNGGVTVFRQTEYGALIDGALNLYNNFKYDESVERWNEILKYNPNFDLAYDGIGESHLRQGNYTEAMEYFSQSNNKQAYSEAFKGYRDQAVRKMLWLIIPVASAFIFGAWLLIRYIGKRNTLMKYAEGRSRFSGKFLYGFYILFHPFDGYYDMKHERRGSMSASGAWLLSGVSLIVLSKGLSSYLFNSSSVNGIDFFGEIFTYLLPIALWIISNWCFTTLMDGEGKLKDIFMFTGYAMLPVAVLFALSIPVSYVLVISESMYMELFRQLGFIWFSFLIFCGNIVIHQYSSLKSIISIILSILGIAIIIFVILLLATSYQKAVALVVNLFQEIGSR